MGIPLWWTADMINASLGECWTAVPVAEQKWVVGEFNCSCVGISKCLPAYCKDDTPNACFNDIPKKDMIEVRKIGSLVGRKGLAILAKAASSEKQAKALDSLKAILQTAGLAGN